MMTYSEFKEMFIRRAGELGARKASEPVIRKSFETYKFAVEFANAKGVLQFSIDRNGDLAWTLG